jgi:hypothetical protein
MMLDKSKRKVRAHAVEARRYVQHVAEAVADLDILDDADRKTNAAAAADMFGKAMGQMQELGAELAQLAIDVGVTKKALAESWEIPASTFTGMTRREL